MPDTNEHRTHADECRCGRGGAEGRQKTQTAARSRAGPDGSALFERAAPIVQHLWERNEREELLRKASRSQADERRMWLKIILPRLGKLRLHRSITTKSTCCTRTSQMSAERRFLPTASSRSCGALSITQSAGSGSKRSRHRRAPERGGEAQSLSQ